MTDFVPPDPSVFRDRVGRYWLGPVLGSGSTGTVRAGWHPGLRRAVAVKHMSPSLVGSPGFLTRFRMEAEVLARVAHTNVVAIYDYLELRGDAFLVMELVAGPSLRAVLARHGRLEPEQALGALAGALTGLAYVHDLDVIHRDVKPENVLLDIGGVSKLVDFGLAGAAGAPGSVGSAGSVGAPGSAGAPGAPVGTPAYASPEAIRGEGLDVRSDLYSTGVVLFELLAGRPPFTAPNSAALMALHLHADPPVLTRVPARLATLCARALAKDPARRPHSAAEMLAELEEGARDGYGADWLGRSSLAGLAAALTAAAGAELAGGGVGAATIAGAATGGSEIANATVGGAAGAAAANTAPAPAPAPVVPAAAAGGSAGAAAARAGGHPARNKSLRRSPRRSPVRDRARRHPIIAGAVVAAVAIVVVGATLAVAGQLPGTTGARRSGGVGASSSGASPPGDLAATLASAQWRPTSTQLRATELDAVTFMDARTGVVTGPGLILVTADGGRSWSSPPLPPGVGRLGAVVCRAAAFCVAAGTTTGGSGVIVRATSPDRAWTRSTLPGATGALVALACPSDNECWAAGTGPAGGPAILRSTDGGNTWADEAVPPAVTALGSLGCTPAGGCVAGGAAGSQLGVILVHDGGGGGWRSAPLPPVVHRGLNTPATSGPAFPVQAVTCPGPSTCFAVDDGGNVLRSDDTGHSWSVAADLVGAHLQQGCATAPAGTPCITDAIGVPAGLSFTDVDHGLLVTYGQCGNPSFNITYGSTCGGQVDATSDGGRTWRTVDNVGPSLYGASCSDQQHCWAVGATNRFGAIFSTADGGASWTELSIPGANEIAVVACPTSRICLASGADDNGHALVMRSTDAGSSWQSVPTPPGDGSLEALTCATAVHCVAADNSATAQVFALVTDDSGQTWSRTELPRASANSAAVRSVLALACATPTTCVAGGDRDGLGGFDRTVDGGHTWQAVSTPTTVGDVFGVACPTANRCVAVGRAAGSSGSTGAAPWGGMTLASQDAGASWQPTTAAGVPPSLRAPTGGPGGFAAVDALDCPSAQTCLALGDVQSADGATPTWYELVSRDGGQSWQYQAMGPGLQFLGAFFCDTNADCVIAGSSTSGAALWTLTGGALHPLPSPGAGQLTFVTTLACPTAATCLAGGQAATTSQLQTSSGP